MEQLSISNARNDKELVSRLDDEFGKRKNAMAKRYRAWDIAERFYEDEHWVRYDQEENRVRNIALQYPRGRDLITIPRIREYTRIMGAQLGTGKPNIGFIPATQSTEDVSASKMCRAVNDYIMRVNDVHVLNHRLHFYKLLYGTAIKCVDWGKVSNKPNVLEEIIHPREILPRLDSKGDFDKVIRFRIIELEILKNHYKVIAEDIEPEAGSGGTMPSSRGKDIFNNTVIAKYENPITLKEYYEEASDRYPQGRYIVWAGNKILEDTQSIYLDGRTPFIRHIFDISTGENFWGLSYVESLIPLQVQINKTATMINEFIKRAVKLIVAVQTGSGVDENAIQFSDMFAMLKYNRNSIPPTALQFGQLSVDPWKQYEMLENQLMDIAHIHLVTKGMAERNVRSDIAQRTLKEQDEHPLSITVQNFEQGEVQAAQMRLQLAKQFYDDGRMISIVGRNNQVHVMPFKKSMITEEIDIVCEPNSAMPSSRAMQQATLLDMLKNGILNPADPKIMRLIREVMQYNSMDVLTEEDEREKSRALAEHEAILKGEEIEVLPIENHMIHKDTHRNQILSEDFLDWTEIEQVALKQHYQRHDEVESAQIDAVAQKLARLQGQPLNTVENQIAAVLNENK